MEVGLCHETKDMVRNGGRDTEWRLRRETKVISRSRDYLTN